ncbi:MAG: flagellar motor switch protein FliN [Alphaproteobacteria bacterium]|jgi:flagellar motor switch protein FliN/FliY|nr:flagellar motor switch protein FliN [Alphaproteobacteria bacterium]MDP7223286.1 flagellar motor switch protein FliN [Alphaproteobacteria bacterium]
MSDDNTENEKPEEAADAAAAADTAEKKNPEYKEIESSLPDDDDANDFEIGEAMANDVTAIYDIPVQISAVLGRSNMQVSQLLKLGRGAVVELDRKVGEAIDIYVNNRLVARGEVVVVEDKLGVTMTEIVKSDRS